MEEFSKDAAAMFIIMGVLDYYSKREYLADKKGSKESTSTDPITGAVVKFIDWIF